jgi:hypothetical protein
MVWRPEQGMRGISRAGNLRVEGGAEMFTNEVGARSEMT